VRLREAGAVILGKTNLLEFAYGIAHPLIGQTNNPHDPGRTSGGSSGGSAAAVAAGIVPLAVGTDTGGSIRIPAAYCGVVGLKPTFGLVPTEGVFPLSPSLDHAGPLARSVADAAALLAVLSGRPMLAEERPPAELRIGVIAAHRASPLLSAGVSQTFEAALARLEAAGARVVDVAVDGLAGANAALGAILLPEAALVHRRLRGVDRGGYATGTLSQIEAGAAATALDYLAAREVAARLRARVETLLTRFDVLASPAVAFVAPAEDPVIGGEEGEGEMLSSGLANLTGHPALSLPCGLSESLPVGLQLIGGLNRDAALLAAAQAVEHVLGFSALPRFGQGSTGARVA
jgi:aspartyl-tRNA(Asn)/glutamyl-tRNA(Gln) amidotransferase subunit A